MIASNPMYKLADDFDKIFNEELVKVGKEPVTREELFKAFRKAGDTLIERDKPVHLVNDLESAGSIPGAGFF